MALELATEGSRHCSLTALGLGFTAGGSCGQRCLFLAEQIDEVWDADEFVEVIVSIVRAAVDSA